MTQILFDDIGSYPLPRGILLEGLSPDAYATLVRECMEQKLAAGVEVPTYPQFRDMIDMFMKPIESPDESESPYIVRKEAAEIEELNALEPLAISRGGPLRLRVCVTGPVELYLSAFGATSYTDILFNLATSVARFLERAKEVPFLDVAVASLDEPSLGISPSIIFEEDDLSKALEIASEPCKDIDCEIHLHSPLYAELCCRVPGINIVGVESATHPDYLKLIDRSILDETDSYLRAGIARTDILSMVAGLNDRLGLNLWTEPKRLEMEISRAESPSVLEGRLSRAYAQFGDRIRCAGPDCGLGSWPSQELARGLLGNCSQALASFRQRAGPR